VFLPASAALLASAEVQLTLEFGFEQQYATTTSKFKKETLTLPSYMQEANAPCVRTEFWQMGQDCSTTCYQDVEYSGGVAMWFGTHPVHDWEMIDLSAYGFGSGLHHLFYASPSKWADVIVKQGIYVPTAHQWIHNQLTQNSGKITRTASISARTLKTLDQDSSKPCVL
jgi:hypothetical protein